MEVHHHSSHAAGSHQSAGKKKWTHYFWEFIMLFLAVTIGFYAENLREVNKHRHEANNNMHSLLSDLQNDVHLFDSVIDRNDYSIAMADTLVSLLHNDLSNTDEIYFAARATTANIGYFYTNTKSFEHLQQVTILLLTIRWVTLLCLLRTRK